MFVTSGRVASQKIHHHVAKIITKFSQHYTVNHVFSRRPYNHLSWWIALFGLFSFLVISYALLLKLNSKLFWESISVASPVLILYASLTISYSTSFGLAFSSSLRLSSNSALNISLCLGSNILSIRWQPCSLCLRLIANTLALCSGSHIYTPRH
jgi:hypothetical protein